MALASPGQRLKITLPETTYMKYALDGWRRSPEKIAIVDINTGEEVTFRQLEQKVRSFAGALQKIGVRSQTKVQFYADNCLNSLIAQQASFFCNASVFAFKTNKSVTEMEYKFQTEDAEIEFILTDAANYDLEVYQLLNDPNCRVKKVVILSGTPTKSTREKLVFTVDQLPKSEFLEPSGVSVKKDLLAVSYTSGSTGLPKGVMHSHYSFVTSLHTMGPASLRCYIESDRFLLLNALTYVSGTIFSSGVLSCGGTLILASHDADNMIPTYIDQYKATVFIVLECAMTTIVSSVTNYPNVEHLIRSIRVILVGGTVFSKKLIAAAEKFFKGAKFMNVYGMTEAFGLVACSDPYPTFPLHVGFGAPNIEIQIVNSEGFPVQIGEAGELLWRGPQMTLGYWKRSSDDFTRDGFYSTGDMAIVDTSGQISIVGRKKFFIICLDERISPTEIEDVLLSHPAVREAIVVGTPHPVVKEAPTAMVVVSSTYTNSRDSLREELVSLVAKQLSDHKHLHGGVHFVESLNQTDSGKYARNIITQQALNIIKGVN